MSSKSRFILNIVILTILFIGFLTGTFMSVVIMSIKGFTNERLGLMLVSLGLGIVSMVKMIRLSNNETQSRIDAVVSDQHEFIAQWTIPARHWQNYLKAKLKFDIKESSSYSYISAGIIALVLAFSAVNIFTLTKLAIIEVSAFTAVFIIVKMSIIYVIKRRYSLHAKNSPADIYFAKSLIIVNGKLTMLSDFGYRLKFCEVKEMFEANVLCLIVERGMGHRKSQHQHYIPIPEDSREEADRLMKLYSGLIE